jgi:hypothetical protein
VESDYEILTFNYSCSNVESYWLGRMIQLILYKNYNFNVTSITYIDGIFTPYIDQDYIYINNIIFIYYRAILELVDHYNHTYHAYNLY